ERAWEKSDSLVCVGLDPEIERFAAHIAAEPSPIFQFNKAIVDATADLVCAYKPQFAHYAAYEAEDQLERTIEYIHKTHPGVPGVGAQAGDVAQAVEAGQTPNGTGLIVSSSRAILYASAGGDFASAARKATARLRAEINASRTKRA